MSLNGHPYDLNFCYIYRVDSSGRAVGQLDPDALGSGPTVSPALLIKGPVKLTTAKAQRTSVEWRGGGVPEGKKQAGVDSINSATLEVTRWDNVLDTLIMGGSIDTTSLVNAEISSPNNMNPSPNTVGFVGITKIDVPGGTTKYLHIVYPSCTITKVTPDIQQLEGNQKNPNNITLTITPSSTTKFPTGKAMGSTQNWYGYSEFEFTMSSLYPYMLDCWIADGSATTFTLTALPKKSTVTTGNNDNWVTKNSVNTAPTSINTSSGLVTVAAAGSAADVWVIWYPVTPTVLAALAV